MSPSVGPGNSRRDGMERGVITVDGPGGSGKGTVSRLLAARLGWTYLDSGALYRVLALAARERQVSLDDEQGLAVLGRSLGVSFSPEGADDRVWLDGRDVTGDIRTETSGNAASKVAQYPAVRMALLERQRAFAERGGLVADGRDMGTVVFPSAGLKIFLTASAEERAKRRHKQLKEKGIDANLSALLGEIAERDRRDSERAVAPLRPAPDAVLMDTTDLGITQVVDRLEQMARIRFAHG